MEPRIDPLPARIALSPAQAKSRRARNIAIGASVGLLVVLFYLVTIFKLGTHAIQPGI